MTLMYNSKRKEVTAQEVHQRYLFETSMFGCTIEAMESYCDSELKISTYQMLAMSMMSDAQEAMARGQLEYARQLLNRAKWVLSTYQVRT
jgi:hypothetical protein